MRRLVVEFSLEGLATSEGESSALLTKVKTFEMLQILKMVPGETAAIVRVEIKTNPAGLKKYSSQSRMTQMSRPDSFGRRAEEHQSTSLGSRPRIRQRSRSRACSNPCRLHPVRDQGRQGKDDISW